MKRQTFGLRYIEKLRNMPPPGGGRHTALLAIANFGIMAGFQPEQIHSDIRSVVASNPIPDAEIHSAILKAAAEHSCRSEYHPPPKSAPLVKSGHAALRRIISQGRISDDADLWEASPIRLYDSPEADPILLLSVLFRPDDLIFIGDRLEPGVVGENIRSAREWVPFFQAGGKAGPFIIINPFTGEPAPKKSGDGDSCRCDSAVKTFSHCLVEFDSLSREDQLRFWSAAKLPILALLDTGGKSIHAWLEVSKISNVSNCDEWTRDIKIGLYEMVLIPLGVDRTCCNPSRLSRLPGCVRSETGRFQRLLWLSPEGREVTRC